jgi:hypothetical protein
LEKEGQPEIELDWGFLGINRKEKKKKVLG